MDHLKKLKTWFETNRSKIENDYFSFLRFASISADPAKRKSCIDCAEWLTSWLKSHGIDSKLIETPGLPLVFAEMKSEKKDAKTLLIYGHYDVQPVDPIDEWHSSPFEPSLREGSIYARGAVDDKGQIFYALQALVCLKELNIPLSCNIKVCIEGEEESTSKGLIEALKSKELQNKLKADDLLVVDFEQFDRGIPAVSLGARGIAALEVSLTGSNIDMHSGLCGGIAYNPNRAIVELLSKLWDKEGKVQVPHFYDGIEELSQEEKKQFSCRYDKPYFEKQFGLKAFGGEHGLSLMETGWFRPTIEINGISGGYTGAGMKTVIPATSLAKITCRLVPGQDPNQITDSIAKFLEKIVTPGFEIKITKHKGMPAFRSSIHTRLAQVVKSAAEEVTCKSCRYMLAGGSIPVVPLFIEALKVNVVGMGYCLMEDQIHAPNERFDMERFEQGFLTVARALPQL